MQSKRCSHNLQSDYQGSSQRICLLIMRITSYTKDRRFFEKEQNHGGRRRDTFSSNVCRYHNFYRKVTSLQIVEHRFSIPELVSLPSSTPSSWLQPSLHYPSCPVHRSCSGRSHASSPPNDVFSKTCRQNELSARRDNSIVLLFFCAAHWARLNLVPRGCPLVSKDFLTQRSFQNFIKKTENLSTICSFSAFYF